MENYGTKIHGNVDMSGDVYYKLIRSRHSELITVACIQWFDESDYDQDRFIRTKENEIHVFETEEMAIEKMLKWFKPEEIEKEYRRKCFDNIRDDD